MYKLLTVIDNRTLLKEVCGYLDEAKQYDTHVVLFSPNAFTEFIEFRPDLVLLDVEAFVYYKQLLSLFSKSTWKHNVLLITSATQSHQPPLGSAVIKKQDLTCEYLLNTIQEIFEGDKHTELEASEEDNQNIHFSNVSGNCTILYAKNTCAYHGIQNSEHIEEVRKVLKSYGVTEITINQNQDILCCYDNFGMASRLSNDKISNIFFGGVVNQYAVFIMRNTPSWDISKALEKVQSYAPLSYFLCQKITDIGETLPASQPIELSDIDSHLARIVHEMLSNNPVKVKNLLKELYYSKLQNSLDFLARDYTQWMFSVYTDLFNYAFKQNVVYNAQKYATVEQEYTFLENFLMSGIMQIQRSNLSFLLRRALAYITMNFCKEISLNETADALKINKNYLSRVFSRHFYTTVLALIQHLRFSKAQFLIFMTDWKIGDISDAVGYKDPHYFSRFIKKKTGQSPEELRYIGTSLKGQGEDIP